MATRLHGPQTVGMKGSGNHNPNGITPEPLPTIIIDIEHLLSEQTDEVELPDPGLVDKDHEKNLVATKNNRDKLFRYVDFEGELFVNGVSYLDIEQNQIGDCYLMNALASLAKTRPDVIQNMFTDHGDGTYTVHFGGEFGDVRVDDDFVVNRAGNVRYAGVGSDATPELWVAVIEKAYAQASGGYQNIVSGWTQKAIANLTGQDDFTVDDVSNFSPTEVARALAEGRSVTANAFSPENKAFEVSPDGIVGRHAYTVLDASQDASGNWQITLYNPWGGSGTSAGGVHRGTFKISWEDFVLQSNFSVLQVMNTPLTQTPERGSK